MAGNLVFLFCPTNIIDATFFKMLVVLLSMFCTLSLRFSLRLWVLWFLNLRSWLLSLRMLNFLERPSRGVIRFEDHEFTESQEMPLNVRRRVTTVFQRPLLRRHSVADNIGYGLRLRGQHDAGRAVRAVLDEVGLAHLEKQPARTLSGGEAQRVALARAMVLNPDALLLDEPTANLDPRNVGIIESIVARLNRERGTTVVLVTHNLFQARRLAHGVALMLDGQVVEVEEVHAFFEAPRDPRTTAFVKGDMVY
jgi:tungstate transport system ATP-binding protein